MGNIKFIKEIIILTKKYKFDYIKGVIMSVVLGGINILLPMIMLKIFDDGVEAASIKMTIIYTMSFVVTTLFSVLLTYKFTMLITMLETKIAYETRCGLTEHILNMPGDFFNEVDGGELYTLLYGDVEKIPSFITSTVLTLIKDILTLFGMAFFLSKLQFELLAILIIYQVVIIPIQNRFKLIVKNENIKFRDSIVEKNKISQEFIFNLFSIICAGFEQKIYKILQNKEEDNIRCNYSVVSVNTKNTLIVSFINALMIATILCYGGIKVIIGELSIGALITFNIFSQRFITPISNIFRFPTEILDYKLSWGKIQERIVELETIKDEGKEFEIFVGVVFDNVKFKHGKVSVLDNCSFNLNVGNMYALVGLSGSGKSTIVKLMFRLWDRYEGDIYIDSNNIKDIRLKSLRGQMAYISQDIFLLNDTLRKNLQSNKNVKDDVLMGLLNKVELGTWFENLPEGLDTILGDNGAKLSGGEKQRVIIARTILQNPKIIIFDEATSMLDEKTEKKIIDLIRREFKESLVVMITHRLRSIESVDNILVLDKGQIVEEGKFSELISNNQGVFYNMFKRGV